MSDTAPQPPPVPTDSEPIYKQVIADIEAKAEVGHAKYGTYLQADNGRDHLADAYQESIDQTKYLKAAMVERRALLDRIAALEAQLAEAQERLAMAVEALSRFQGAKLKEKARGLAENTHTPIDNTQDLALCFYAAMNVVVSRLQDALAATADAVAQHTASVERRGAAKELREQAKELRDLVAERNPPCFADRLKIEPGYLEACDDIACDLEARAVELEGA